MVPLDGRHMETLEERYQFRIITVMYGNNERDAPFLVPRHIPRLPVLVDLPNSPESPFRHIRVRSIAELMMMGEQTREVPGGNWRGQGTSDDRLQTTER